MNTPRRHLRPANPVPSPSRAKRRRARRLPPSAVLAAVVVAAVLIAGCGTSNPLASASKSKDPKTTASQITDSSKSKPTQSLQAYARCIRAHGVPNFKLSASPTGSAGGGSSGKQQGPYGSPSATMRTMQAAHKACEKYEPVADRG